MLGSLGYTHSPHLQDNNEYFTKAFGTVIFFDGLFSILFKLEHHWAALPSCAEVKSWVGGLAGIKYLRTFGARKLY